MFFTPSAAFKMPSPIITATLQAAGLSTASNLFAQLIEARQQGRAFSLDLLQLLRFVTLTLITAPPNYHWQQFLERTFPAYPSGHPQQERLGDIEIKPAEDIPELKEGYEERIAQINRDNTPKFSLRNTLTKCFSFIPVHWRIVFLSFIGLLWGIYMSLVAARV
ncbi:hypothetical protein ACJ41O_005950 [Fusarium nematophilum]